MYLYRKMLKRSAAQSGSEPSLADPPALLTTGMAARMIGVTPDTVLRWIKQGRLQAKRTTGGHSRIPLENLQPLIEARHQTESECSFTPLHCWEYLNPHGDIREECQRCIVYRSKATWCFRLAELGADVGCEKVFCRTVCEDCVYYRRLKRLASRVLVISSGGDLEGDLTREPRESLSLRFARSVYEASSQVGSFAPGFVVLDCGTAGIDVSELVKSIANDIRVPGVRIILAARAGSRRPRMSARDREVVIGVLEKPFDVRCIETLIDGVPVEALSNQQSSGEEPDTGA